MLRADSSKKKGQVLTQDFTVSIVIFSAVLVLTFQLMDISYEKKSWFETNQIVVQDLMRKVDYLVRNPGVPSGWNEDNVVVVGFADSDHMLNLTKLIMFKHMDYSKQRALFGVGGDNFYIALKNSSNDIIQLDGELLYAGKLPPADANMLLVTKRFVYITNDSTTKIPAILEGGIWK